MADAFGADTDILAKRAFDGFHDELNGVADRVTDGIAANPLPDPDTLDSNGPDAPVKNLPDPGVVVDFCRLMGATVLAPQQRMNDLADKFAQVEEINADLGSTYADTSIKHH